MKKLLPENINVNHSSLQTSTTDQKNAKPTKTTKTKTSTSTPKRPKITVIAEIQIIPETQTPEITFLPPPSVVTNNTYHLLKSTLDPNGVQTPNQTIEQTESNNENTTNQTRKSLIQQDQ